MDKKYLNGTNVALPHKETVDAIDIIGSHMLKELGFTPSRAEIIASLAIREKRRIEADQRDSATVAVLRELKHLVGCLEVSGVDDGNVRIAGLATLNGARAAIKEMENLSK